MTEQLPAVNASLNGVATILLICGYWAIKSGRRETHIRFMIGALAASVLFLTSYVIYHAKHGSTPYPGTGFIRTVYFIVLIPHVILAAVNVPMIILTVLHAARKRWDKHKRIARWTLPIWLYVSVTGVLVYLMLHVWSA